MDGIMDTCRTLSLVFAANEQSTHLRESNDVAYGMGYNASSLTRGIINPSNAGMSSYLRCNFPSTPLPCTGSSTFGSHLRAADLINGVASSEGRGSDRAGINGVGPERKFVEHNGYTTGSHKSEKCSIERIDQLVSKTVAASGFSTFGTQIRAPDLINAPSEGRSTDCACSNGTVLNERKLTEHNGYSTGACKNDKCSLERIDHPRPQTVLPSLAKKFVEHNGYTTSSHMNGKSSRKRIDQPVPKIVLPSESSKLGTHLRADLTSASSEARSTDRAFSNGVVVTERKIVEGNGYLPGSYKNANSSMERIDQPLPHSVLPSPEEVCSTNGMNPLEIPSRSEDRWVRPLGYAEKFMSLAGYWGNMTTVYSLWLDSRGPISLEAVKKTSYLMLRKMPHLNLVIGYRNGKKWWKRKENMKLDIEEIQTDENLLNVFEALLKRRYNVEEGPLWFVRFLTSINRNDLVIGTDKSPMHKYVAIFGFHHNVSDGTTNMKFCNIFVSLLNDIIKCRELNLTEAGRFAAPIHDDLANAEYSHWFLFRLLALRLYKGIIAYCSYVKNFIRHYPLSYDQEGCTRVLLNEFDEVTTKRLLNRCKMEEVTLNSAFTAACNIGMYRMILERDNTVKSTRFDSQQTINMRRYWPSDKQKNAFGCHISMIDVQIPTDINDIDNFWEYVRKVHKLIYKELNTDKRVVKIQPLSEKLCLAILINYCFSKLRLPSTNDSHYCITNMGNVSSLFNGSGEEVTVSKILRSVSCHFLQSLCQHTLQTFNGKFYYSLDYYPQKMPADTARAYASSLMDTLRRAIHMPN